MKKRKIKLSGYARNNLGDDLFFKILLERYPDTDFYFPLMTPGFYNKAMSCYDNLIVRPMVKHLSPILISLFKLISDRKAYWMIIKICNFFHFRGHFRCRKSKPTDYDATVIVIGSMYMEEPADNTPPIDLSAYQMADTSYQLKSIEEPKYILGVNIGPVYTERFLKNNVQKDLEGCVDVCFRDRTSYQLFSFLPNTRYAPDIVFNLDTAPYQCEKHTNEILVNIVDIESKLYEKQNAEACYQSIINGLKEFIDRGFTVDLVSFCRYENDDFPIRKILKQIEKPYTKKIKTYFYYNSIDEILRLFGRCQYVIAGRFHAMILAMIFQKPVFPICYNDKMFHYLKDIDFCGSYADIQNLHRIGFEEMALNLSDHYIADITEHVDSAKQCFSALDKLLPANGE